VYLRGRKNVYKRVLIHVSALNLSLVMRQWLGKGTPRGWQGFSADALLSGLQLWIEILGAIQESTLSPMPKTLPPCSSPLGGGAMAKATSTTDC
jgi:hypothetical protein